MTRTTLGRAHPAASRKTAPARSARKSGWGGTLIGLFVGIALGLGLAAAVAYYLMKSGNPYQATVTGAAHETKDAAKPARPDAAADKPRFDFYKILPGVDEPRQGGKSAERAVTPDKATLDRAASPGKTVAKIEDAQAPPRDKAAEAAPRAAKGAERFWIQAGSFTNENDAENLKAQLALSGWEASVQAASLPDKSLRYRVRLGPYDNAAELARVKDDLAKHGVDVAVIKGQ